MDEIKSNVINEKKLELEQNDDDNNYKSASPPPPNDTAIEDIIAEVNSKVISSNDHNRNDSGSKEEELINSQLDNNSDSISSSTILVPSNSNNSQSITDSTLVITKSQIIEESNSELDKYVDLESLSKENNTDNTTVEETKQNDAINKLDNQLNKVDEDKTNRKKEEAEEETVEIDDEQKQNDEFDSLSKTNTSIDSSPVSSIASPIHNPNREDSINHAKEDSSVKINDDLNKETRTNDLSKSEILDEKTNRNLNDDFEKIVKEEYEIPNFNNENTNNNQTNNKNNAINDNMIKSNDSFQKEIYSDIEKMHSEITQELKELEKSEETQKQEPELKKDEVNKEPKKEKKIEDEVFERILGNDSLMKKTTHYGDDDVRPKPGQMCTIAYDAYLKDGNKLVEHEDSLSFLLGDGDVINGLDMGVCMMTKNEKCELVVDARHAYGATGKGTDIPPNAALTYKIHLKDIQDVALVNELQPVERLSLGEAKKLRGNFLFNRQDFNMASIAYKKGLKYFDVENFRGDENAKDIEKFTELRLALLMNLALSNYKLNEYKEALASLDEVLTVQNKHMKALYIKGKVLNHLGETADAIKFLNKALEVDPNNIEVKKELVKAQSKHKTQYENEKKLYQKMISAVGQEENLNKNTSKQINDSGYLKLLAAGIVIAVASIGIGFIARYKNLI